MVNHSALKCISITVLMAALAGCGEKAKPVSAEQARAEKEAATKATRENPVYGDQLKAMDKAKAATDEAAKLQAEALKAAEEPKDPMKTGY